ncbi:MAG: hypothetical protein ACI936_001543 [Paraglaciecola sp.]|jgi:hypothetical protein
MASQVLAVNYQLSNLLLFDTFRPYLAPVYQSSLCMTDTYKTKVQHTKVQFRLNTISFIIYKDYRLGILGICSKKLSGERLASKHLTTLFII